MARYSQSQVKQLCLEVGFKEEDAKVASAIALCESPAYGYPGFADSDLVGDINLSDNTWGYSYGLFQVRSLHSQWGTGQFRDGTRLLDPRFNCLSALRIFQYANNKFTPWSTFVNGAYKAYMPEQFPPKPGTYVVVAGDTLSGIAAKLNAFPGYQPVTVTDLAKFNPKVQPPAFMIYIGQVLQLPYLEYTVAPGDTLWDIGQRTNTNWGVIADYNKIPYPYTIYPNQRLRIPR